MILTLLSGALIGWVFARRRKRKPEQAGLIPSNSP
jgi:hypothetical protein